jgi:hypothetical protein
MTTNVPSVPRWVNIVANVSVEVKLHEFKAVSF